MPKRTDIKSILIIGAGPIVIGQACEFDYSGTQACKALRAEGYRIILANSNPATIMTDPELADATYVEPITPDFVARIIEAERPDALLATVGGQTALNCAVALARTGVLERFGVEMIGARLDAIERAENRQLFRETMEGIGLACPRARIAHTLEEAEVALKEIGLPTIIRPSYTLGGWGGGIARTHAEFVEIVAQGLDASPETEVLIEESVLGWKEFEMEVIRDRADNAIIICSIENIDPMGVHTGDSITVAPALTLTDKEYQTMRTASIACLRAIGVETGGSNVQFAVNPEDGRLVVIEMNPRVSRSSALASKATGFPIAKVAARLAVGYTLDELDNDITGATPASFEPVIDYVVTKIPRFAFEKFPNADATLTTSMKSVGEAMAMGRSFAESLQKALRSLETGLAGLDEIALPDAPEDALARPTPDRLLFVAQALREGMSVEAVCAATKIDPWFIRQIDALVRAEADIRRDGLPKTAEAFRRVKAQGFGDARLAALTGAVEADVRNARHALGVRPVFKRVDTCAAEFAAGTAYMYATYETPYLDGADATSSCEALPSDKKKAVILGGGPNRIGQGIEFDYCCCHAAFALEAAGVESIMVNCNPETVSTDYDTSDRLYFEPLTTEDVFEILHVENTRGTLEGVIVQFGGQTPLKLAHDVEAAGYKILGTAPDAIDLAEDRDRFTALVKELGLHQPPNGIATSLEEARDAAARIGYPVLLRPSYVLGGRAMEVIPDAQALERYMRRAISVSGTRPILIDSFLSDAIEVDVDAISDGKATMIAGIMEHIEEAGVHSGDSACALPPFSLSAAQMGAIEDDTRALARALKVRGLMNVQYALKDDVLYVLEVNPRASRTAPFVAKATGVPVVRLAVAAMLGTLPPAPAPAKGAYVAVKESVFPFARFPGVDTVLGPEMRSTGEVMGLDRHFAQAFAKSQIASGTELPASGVVFISVRDADKPRFAKLARKLCAMGFTILSTHGTAAYLREAGLEAQAINKVREGTPHIVEAIEAGGVQLVFNTTEGAQAISDSASLRRATLTHAVPYYTTWGGAAAALEAIGVITEGGFSLTPLQSFATPPATGAKAAKAP